MSEVDELEMARRAKVVAAHEEFKAGLRGARTWDTAQLQEDFEVIGFLAPFMTVRRRSDGVRGSLRFNHNPRVYWDWESTDD